ncbi:MAG: division/cell wall cluster transcriptional repressor MraZ [Thermoflexales bacterium]|nr:division/cell wall cluster transcriptional repressor MraZ [Thermoflexales bacterium]
MFLGEFNHTVDDKGRVSLPAKFRPELNEGLVVTHGLDGCLFIFTLTDFRALGNRVSDLPLTLPGRRDFERMLFARAVSLSLDKQGRILLPQALREFAGVDGEVVVVGVNTRIEIWSQVAWQERCQKFEGGALDEEHWAQLGI